MYAIVALLMNVTDLMLLTTDDVNGLLDFWEVLS
jgi:hypothetical protein